VVHSDHGHHEVTTSHRRPGSVAAVSVAAIVIVVVTVVASLALTEAVGWVAAGVVVAWATAAVVIVVARRDTRAAFLALAVAGAGAAALLSIAWATGELAAEVTARDSWDAPTVARALAITLVTTAIGFLVVGAPDGRFDDLRRRRVAIGLALFAVAVTTILAARGPDVSATVVIAHVALVAALSLDVFVRTCRASTPIERAKLQWLGWGAVVSLTSAGTVAVVHWLMGWPPDLAAFVIGSTVAVPAGIAASSFARLLRVVDRVLVVTIVILGLVLLAGAVYLVTVLGLHGVPEGGERTVLGLSLVAALIVAVAVNPVRRRLEDFAMRRVYGGDQRSDGALETFASRMSRAIPMDELLLQLAESLKRSMKLTGVELWTGHEGRFERSVAVPDRGPAHLELESEAQLVAARAHVQGNAWLTIWIRELLDGREHQAVRFTSIAHLGELLGFIITERPPDDRPLDDEAERQMLIDIARPLGLALHNMRLDTALQATLDEVRAANRELVASRARIVAATDETRRRIERDLHDGAQQHLVALAVKVGLVRKLLEADPEMAVAMLDELRHDAQAALTELRELAHGIYPPLLRDRGLTEALRTAAQRSSRPATVEADEVGRYGADIEAAVYFCCLEALQNAAKHAGEDAVLHLRLAACGTELVFEVTDDGVGFEPDAVSGKGFINMRDRLGAFDGRLDVSSVPGRGTTIRGSIPHASHREPGVVTTRHRDRGEIPA
jgi:signal transduction histidine kinase